MKYLKTIQITKIDFLYTTSWKSLKLEMILTECFVVNENGVGCDCPWELIETIVPS